MLAIKSDTRYRFKTKRVKYTAIWKKSIKIVKESKLSFFTTFPSSIFYSLLHNFIIFVPHSWIPSSTILIFSLNFFILSTKILIFSLLLILLYMFSIQDHIYPTSTLPLHRLHIDPTSILHRPQIDPTSTLYTKLFLTQLREKWNYMPPPPSHFYCFPSTSTTFLLFSFLQLTSIVFPRKNQRGQNQAQKAKLKCDGLILSCLDFSRKNNRN